MSSSRKRNRSNLFSRGFLVVITVLPLVLLSQFWMLNWRVPLLANVQSKSIAGHRVVRVFNQTNSPIGGSAFRFKPGKLFQDRAHRLWVAPSIVGERLVATFEETTGRWLFFGERQDLSLSSLNYRPGAVIPFDVNRIVESRSGEIWFVDDSANPKGESSRPTLTSFDGKSWRVHDIAKDTPNFARTGLFSDTNGSLWFWAGEKLWRYEGKDWSPCNRIFDSLRVSTASNKGIGGTRKDETSHYGQTLYEIFDVIKDRDGLWWFAFGGGIGRFDEQKKEWKKFPQIQLTTGIYEDRAGRIWFVDDAVSVYNKAEDSVRTFRLSDHFSADDCGDSYPALNCIYQDKRGQMFFGHGCGLIRYDEAKERWDLVSLADIGLANEVEDIMEDRDGRIWISTRSGLVVLDS